MNWGKVFLKFLRGVFVGGIGSVISNPSVITGNDVQKTATVSMAVGVASAFLNWWKHKDNE